MKYTIKIYYNAIAVLFFMLSTQQTLAQIVAWELPPSDYTQISRFGVGLYQVTGATDKVGLIRPDGTIVVPVEADEIGQFYEGTALVTVHESGQHRVLGALTDDGTYNAFKTKYYTLGGQEFYSDGLLSVQDEKGKKGYIDKSGTPVCGFDRNYYRIKPFTDGYASVSNNGSNYYLINKYGEKQSLRLSDIGNIVVVYNPVQGKSLARDDYNNCYLFTLGIDSCENLHKKAKQPLSIDYLFRPKYMLDRAGLEFHKTVPFVTLPTGILGLSPTRMLGGYGFETDGKIILPGQLDNATPFEDDLSIVSIGGRTGLLRYYADQHPFSINIPQEQYNFDAGNTVACRFNLSVPQVWNDKQLHVRVHATDGDTELQPEVNGQEFTIHIQPQRSSQKKFNVSVASEGLMLWDGQIAFTLKRNAVPLQLSDLKLDDNLTDSNYKVTGSFSIYNPNEDEVETELIFTHSEQVVSVGGFPHKVSIRSEERKRVTFFIVTTNRRGFWDHTITVNSSKGGSATITREIEHF